MKFKKGSALVLTLIILGIVSTISLSLALVSARERRGAMGVSKTGLSYQTADEGAEKVMYDILKSGKTTTNELYNCNGVFIIPIGNSYRVELLDEDDARIDCGSGVSMSTVKSIKSVGTSPSGNQNTQRSVKMSVPKTYCNGTNDDTDTKLLLHMDGGTTGTEFIDSSSGNHTADISKGGTPSISSTDPDPKFCNIGRFEEGDYLRIADSNDWNFEGENFTVDFWYKTVEIDGAEYDFLLGTRNPWQIFIMPDGRLNCKAATDGSGGWNVDIYDPVKLEVDRWYHIAFVRNGNDWKCYKNGVSFGVKTDSGDIDDDSAPLEVSSSNPANYPNGFFDEIRIVKGQALFTEDFSNALPEEPY